ncbi:coiled-coil-helix-coiled-coil-helix domain containing 3b isoform 2-T2 [Pholidichthys leucotaenia]
MGGNGQSHFTGEDEGGGITLVQGVRLSDKVINRMRQSPNVIYPAPSPESQAPAASPVTAPSKEHIGPPLTPQTPSFSPPQEFSSVPPPEEPAPPLKLSPPPVKFYSHPPHPCTPPELLPSPAVEPVVPPAAESVVRPLIEPETPTTLQEPGHTKDSDILPSPVKSLSASVAPSVEAPPAEDVVSTPVVTEVPPAADSKPLSPHPSEHAASPLLIPVLSLEEAAPSSCQCLELDVVNEPQMVPPPVEEPTMTSSLPPVVEDEVPEAEEEEVKQKIKEELQRNLKEELNQRREELQQQLEEMKAQAQAVAKAAARTRVEEQVRKTEEAEKLTDAIVEARVKTKDESITAQLYWLELKAHQLDEKEKEVKKRNELYMEHLEKLEAKCSEFYKASVEGFQKGKEETQKRFARFNVQPVCGDLQSQILRCYKENTGKTLTCSGIASAYMECVDNAKKNKLSTGG